MNDSTPSNSEFIKRNDKEFLTFYGTQLISNLSELNKKQKKDWLLMIITSLIYFLMNQGELKSINIGPLSLKSLKITTLFIPAFLFYLWIRLVHLQRHIKEIKSILNDIYKERLLLTDQEVKNDKYNKFSKALYHLSFSDHGGEILPKNLNKIIAYPIAILIIPILIAYFSPIFIIVHSIIEIYNNYLHTWYGVTFLFCYLLLFIIIMMVIINHILKSKKRPF